MRNENDILLYFQTVQRALDNVGIEINSPLTIGITAESRSGIIDNDHPVILRKFISQRLKMHGRSGEQI